MFGEKGIIYKERRSCSVNSTNFTTLGKIDLHDMEELFVSYPQFQSVLVEKVKEYDD